MEENGHTEHRTHSPGIVLSKMKATEPPTNMAVVRRTFSTWSISMIPVQEGKRSFNVKKSELKVKKKKEQN